MRVYEFTVSRFYPNNYWADICHNAISVLDQHTGKRLTWHDPVIFGFSEKLSTRRVLFTYNLYHCYAGTFISPLLASLLMSRKNIENELQLIDAVMLLNKKEYRGYKMLNVLRKVSCVDMEKSETEPVFRDEPDGRKYFTKMVFKEVDEEFNIAIAAENKHQIVISEDLRNFLFENKVKGLDLSP